MPTIAPVFWTYLDSRNPTACRRAQSSGSIRSCDTHKQDSSIQTTTHFASPIHQSLDTGTAGWPMPWDTELTTETVREVPEKPT